MRFMLKKGPGGYEVHLNYNFVGKKENITPQQSYYDTVLRNKDLKHLINNYIKMQPEIKS